MEKNQKVDIESLKRLRNETGAGMSLCKKALLESFGKYEASKELLKQWGRKRALEKAQRATPEANLNGFVNTEGTKAVLMEIACETDFVSRNEEFKNSVSQWPKKLLENADLAQGLEQARNSFFEEERLDLIARTDENIKINRVIGILGSGLLAYVHSTQKIAVIASVRSKKGCVSEDIFKVPMQLAFCSGPDLWSAQDASSKEFSVHNLDLSSVDTASQVSWDSSLIFSEEKVNFATWLQARDLEVLGYFRWKLAQSSEKLGQNFSGDVNALLSRYQ